MPFLLRIIRKSKWYPVVNGAILSKDDFPADPLADLNTKDNRLSVWYIKDDESNLQRVATAYAASRDSLAHFEYVLFDIGLPSNMKIDLMETKGGTKDEYVNELWHRDLDGLTALRLVDLAVELAKGARRERIPEKKIKKWVAEAVANGQIDELNLSDRIRKKL